MLQFRTKVCASKQDNKIGQNIKELRHKANLTQEQLAAKMQINGCDISRGTLAKIETGIRHLYIDELKCLKEILNVAYEDILKS
ncbi:helix-turn-helix transcriptional regulator [Caproiciproducens galactitolivorans]|nr:helix-turn-helix transcriptional regulator [Caproiciproducens galactitolivorans]QEY35987.1 helix-turn-helix transcriptional regulator [Caproiciproducens galactitolivorans]